MQDSSLSNYQEAILKSLEQSYASMAFRLIFKPKISFDMSAYYIGFSDMSRYEYNIRKKVGEEFDDDHDPIAATFSSLREILEAGWWPD
jgi:hypothetical protein